MTAVFAVLGARRDDPSALLLPGDDGAYDAYDAGFAPEAEPTRGAPDDGWALDAAAEAEVREGVG